MNERAIELYKEACEFAYKICKDEGRPGGPSDHIWSMLSTGKFAELIVREMCGLMEQAEDDAYHCFEPSERPTEYINWLRDWQERFVKHFGVEEC